MASTFAFNPFRAQRPDYDVDQHAALDFNDASRACHDIAEWPVYSPTPLVSMPGMAAELGIAALHIKDEGQRQPLLSFKALGGAYALGEFLKDAIEADTGTRPTSSQMFDGHYAGEAAGFHVTAATDGNHGRSLAWGAQLFGAKCTIFIPQIVTDDRAEPMRRFGAEIVRVEGNYDDAVSECENAAAKHGWIHVQDTSKPGFTTGHKRIMEGYTLMVEEILSQTAKLEPFTHMFLQVGCGGMAAAIAARFWKEGADRIPETILVQSDHCDPLVRTFRTSTKTIDHGSHDTIMVGIACGEVAMLSEALLFPIARGAMTTSDQMAAQVMRVAAAGETGDKRMTIGETGAAGLAALYAASHDAQLREDTGLDEHSRVLIINSEGATAPEMYRKIVGAEFDTSSAGGGGTE